VSTVCVPFNYPMRILPQSVSFRAPGMLEGTALSAGWCLFDFVVLDEFVNLSCCGRAISECLHPLLCGVLWVLEPMVMEFVHSPSLSVRVWVGIHSDTVSGERSPRSSWLMTNEFVFCVVANAPS